MAWLIDLLQLKKLMRCHTDNLTHVFDIFPYTWKSDFEEICKLLFIPFEKLVPKLFQFE